jgi:hypothetical protein
MAFSAIINSKDQIMETNENTGKKHGFGYFMLLFAGFVVTLIVISQLLILLMK